MIERLQSTALTRSTEIGVEEVYLGLGSNQGDRAGMLSWALERIAAWSAVELEAVSRIFESTYVGPGRQEPYLNLCARLRTTRGPRQLLRAGQRLEMEAGRPSNGHLRPRALDIDLLLYGRHVLREEGLIVPHPRLRQRRFVLEPLLELAPALVLPDTGRSLLRYLRRASVAEQEVTPT